jgi:putative chitinase
MININVDTIITLKKIPNIKTLFLVFMFGILLSPAYTHAQEIAEQQPNLVPTIRSIDTAGSWHSRSTWLEGRLPQAGDIVQINGTITISNNTDIRMNALHITSRGSVYENYYGPVNIYAGTVFLEQGSQFRGTATSLFITETLYNYGIIEPTIFTATDVYNYGTINFVNLTGVTERILVGFHTISNTYVRDNIILGNNPVFKKIHLGTHTISFSEGNTFLAVSELRGEVGARVIGDIYTQGGRANIYVPNIMLHTLYIDTPTYMYTDTIITGDIVLSPYMGMYYSDLLHHSLIIHGDVTLQESAEIKSTLGNIRFEIHGDLYNNGHIADHIQVYSYRHIDTQNGTIDTVYLYGEEPLDLKGFEHVAYTEFTSHIVSIHDISFNTLRPREYRVSFSDNRRGFVFLYDQVFPNLIVDGSVVIAETVSTLADSISADIVIINAGVTLQANRKLTIQGNLLIKESGSLSRDFSNNEPIFIDGDVVVEPLGQLLNSPRIANLFIHGNLYIEGATQAQILLWNPEMSDHYFFRYDSPGYDFHEDTSSEHGLGKITIPTTNTLITPFMKTGGTLRWHTKIAGEESYGDMFTINIPIYLEPNTTFFTITIPQEPIYQHDDIPVSIQATDSEYTGTIWLTMNGIIPVSVHMIDGYTSTILVSPLAQDEISLYATSGLLSGVSIPFNIVPRFTLSPAPIETEEEYEDTQSDDVPKKTPYVNKVLSFFGFNKNILPIESDEPVPVPELDIPVQVEIISEEFDEPEISEPVYFLENTCIPLQSSRKTLQKGMKGQDIQHMQEYLNLKGYQTGTPDGIFGNQTKQALIDFQTDYHIGIDGVYGSESNQYIQEHCADIIGVIEKQDTQQPFVEIPPQETLIIEKESMLDKVENFFENIWDGLGNWWNLMFNIKETQKKEIPILTNEINNIEYVDEVEKKENQIDIYITKVMLKNAFGLDVDQEIINEMNNLLPVYEINTLEQKAHFLSQVAHESGFRSIEEYGNYSFNYIKQHFSEEKYPYFYNNWVYYKGNREKILNYLYRNRMGNGDEASGDGFKYRGRGLIQLTGKNNYQDFSLINQESGVYFVENPDLLLTQKYAIRSAMYFWEKTKLNNYAYSNSEDSIYQITKRINGGYHGIEDRKLKFNRIYNILKNN